MAKEVSIVVRSSAGKEIVGFALKTSGWAVEFVCLVSAEGFYSGPCIRAFPAFSKVDRKVRLLRKSINKALKPLK